MTIITTHTYLVTIVVLVLSVLIGARAVDHEEKYDYIDSNFIAPDVDLLQAQITVRDDNLLSNSAILAQLKTECAIVDNETVNQMFTSNQPVTGAANAIASAAIYEKKAAQLRAREQALQQREDNLSENVAQMRAAIDETCLLQNEYDRLNRSRVQGDIDDETYELESDRIEREFKVIRTQGTTNLTPNQRDTFVDLRQGTKTLQLESDA